MSLASFPADCCSDAERKVPSRCASNTYLRVQVAAAARPRRVAELGCRRLDCAHRLPPRLRVRPELAQALECLGREDAA